jgi:hypothetical protein
MPSKIRLDHEPPEAVSAWGWKYHHTGIPTKAIMPNEKYVPLFKFFVSGFNSSPFGIEWMRFEKDSPISKIIQDVPHIAFEVENIDEEIKKHNLKVLTPPNTPSDNIRVAMIEHNDAPIELIEFHK